MKKAFEKIIPALIMVAIATVLVGTSTFAWFSMNRKVTVTGMTVTTKVSDNLSVAEYNRHKGGDPVDKQYLNYLTQERAGRLRPASTVDGLSFWYTDPYNVRGNGDANSDEYTEYNEDTALDNSAAGKTHYDAAFNNAFEIETPVTEANVIYGYIDYTFYIKATNAAAYNQNLVLEVCNLLYNGRVIGVDKAWRIAVFARQVARDTDYDGAWVATGANSDLKAILKVSGANNFTDGNAVNGGNSLGTVTYNSDANWAIDSVVAGATEYNKITLRLWLEGEDDTCNNQTFARLTRDYTLDLAFSLGGTSVTYINSELIAAEKSAANTNTVTVWLDDQGRVSNGQFPVSYQWYRANGTIVTGETDRTVTVPYDSSSAYYCEVTTAQGTYKTAAYLYNPAVNTSAARNYAAVRLDGSGNLDNGQTPETYRWYKTTDTDTVLGAESAYSITDSMNNGSYYCLITVGTGENEVTYKSRTVNLSFAAPALSYNAFNTGATVTLNNNETVTAYEWRKASDDSVVGGSASFSITNQAENGDYYCEVTTDKGLTYVSNTVTLNCTPEVTGNGTDTATVTLEGGVLTNGQTPSSYQWYKVSTTSDPDEAVGTDSASFHVSDAAYNGEYYCVITTAAATYTTATVNLTFVTP